MVPVVAGVAAALAAHLDALGALLAGGAIVAIGVAMMAPGFLLAALLALVLVQDVIVDGGLGAARYGDEALLLAGLVGVFATVMRECMRGGVSDRTPRPRAALASAPRLRARIALARTPLDLPLLALAAIMLASAVSAGVPLMIATLGMLALLKGPLAFQLASRVSLGDEGVRRVAGGLAMLAAAAALVGVAQRVGGEAVFAITGRAEYFETWLGVKAPGPFSHHNALGHVTVLGGVLALSLASAAEVGGRWAERRQMRVVALCCLAGLLASASRESWIAASVAAIVVALVTRRRRALGAAASLGSALAIVGGLSYFVSPILRAEMARRLAGVTAGWHDFGAGFTGWAFRGEYRVYAALKSAEITADNPLLGVGPGRFGGAVAQRFGSPVHEAYRVLPLDGIHEPLDLLWARLPAEIGLLGALAYLGVFGSAMVVCGRGARRAGVGALSSGGRGAQGGRACATLEGGRAALGGRAAALSSGGRGASGFVRAMAYGGVGALVAAAVFAAFSPALEDPLVSIPVFVWAGVVWRLGRSERSSTLSIARDR